MREFRTLLIRTYSASVTEYSNPRVEYLSSHLSPDGDRATVRTRLTAENQPPIAVDYSLRQANNRWKIYDVAFEGVSLAVNYRTSFAQEIRSAGLDGLIARLASRNTEGCPVRGGNEKTTAAVRC